MAIIQLIGQPLILPVASGGIGVPAIAQFVGPLENYTTNLLGAWSVGRRLLASYSGPLIRVRRSSDSTEADVNADANGVLDETALLNFCGAGNGYVVRIYDQSGGSSNAVQTTAAAQPLIVNGGVLQECGGLPACVFDGSDDRLLVAGVTNQETQAYSAILKSSGATWNDYGSLFETNQDDGGTSRLGLMSQGSTSWHTDPVVNTVRKNGSTLTGPSFNMTTVNAAMVLGVDTNLPTVGPYSTQIGALGNVYYLAYSLAELVAWSATENRAAFEANQKGAIGL